MMRDSGYILKRCVWELTLLCNLRCIHCGSTAGRPRNSELSLGEALEVADQLVELGCKSVTLIGGEVLLYKGWEQVARRISDGGIHVNIITNAFRMGDEELEQISYARLSNVGISLDGMEASHDHIRGAGSFGKVMEAFAKLRARDIPTGVVTSLMSLNIDDLDAMYGMLTAQGIETWQLQIATPMGNLAGNRALLLPPEKLPIITGFIVDKLSEGQLDIYAADNIGYYDANEPCLREPGSISLWQGCRAGLNVIGIDSAGNVRGCESLGSDFFIEGNLRHKRLAEIWNSPDAFAYNRQFEPGMLTGACSKCDKGPLCRGGCRAMCYFSTGRLHENPYCCYPEK